MAEYSRGQKKQLSRAIANNVSNSRKDEDGIENVLSTQRTQLKCCSLPINPIQTKAFICQRPLGENDTDKGWGGRGLISHSHIIFDNFHYQIRNKIQDTSMGGNDGKNIGYHDAGGGTGALFSEDWANRNYSPKYSFDDEMKAVNTVQTTTPSPKYSIFGYKCHDYVDDVKRNYLSNDDIELEDLDGG